MLHAPTACTWLRCNEGTAVKAAPHSTHLPIRRPLRAVQPTCHTSCKSQPHTRKAAGRCFAWGRGKKKPEVPQPGSNGAGPPAPKPEPESDAERATQARQLSMQQAVEQNSQLSSQSSSQQSSTIVSSSGNAPASNKRQQNQHTNWEDWEDWDSDWEANDAREGPPDQFRKRNPRRGMGNATPRDEYLRPMIDRLGIQYRLGFKQMEAEERVQTEFETNQWESREAVKFGAIFLTAPLVTGWVLSSIIANPIFTAITSWNPQAFEISEKQKIEGAKDIHKAEMRMRMDAAIGRAPPLSYSELQAQLRQEAHELVEEFQEKNKHNVLNVISDGITALTGFIILVKDTEGRAILSRTFGRLFGGLSDTAKAFMIIASTDILLGYHSEEGWTAAIRLITAHYGSEVEEGPIYTFVAIVPVTMDALFKYWIFKGLNRKNPAAAVTLKSMDRH